MSAGPILFAALGAALGFAAIWFGLPLLGAIEHGVGIRFAISALAALFAGSVAGFIARGRAVAAAAEGAMMGDASEALLAHRQRKSRAKLAGLAAAVLGSGLGYALLGVLYAHLNEDRYEFEQLELGGLELGFAVGGGLLLALLVWRVLEPGPFVEEEHHAELPVGSGAAVSDEELADTVGKVRAVRRREALARYGSLAAAFGTLIGLAFFALPWLSETLDVDVGGKAYLLAFAAAIAVGVVVNRALHPNVDLHELEQGDAPRPESLNATPAEAPTFAGLLDDAGRLEVSRKLTFWRWLGLDAGRSYALSADSVALADAAEVVVSPLGRLLPARFQPYRVELRDEHGLQLSLDGGWLGLSSPNVAVRDAEGASVGRVEASLFLRRFRLVDARGQLKLELRGSFFSRRQLAILRGGETVGWMHVARAATGLTALVSGQQHQLELELPADASPEERRLLAASAMVVDRRHY